MYDFDTGIVYKQYSIKILQNLIIFTFLKIINLSTKLLLKTKGIVIHYIRYSESSIITKIYTKELGLQSYIVNGIRSPKSKYKIALFQPLTLLEMVVYHQKNVQKIFRISELKCFYPYKTIPFDFQKNSIALFLSEILGRVLQEESPYPELYDFLEESMISFDTEGKEAAYFHIRFLLRLTKYLGVEIVSSADFFEQLAEWNPTLFTQGELEYLSHWINLILDENQNSPPEDIPHELKRQMIDALMAYYRLHIVQFPEIKSLIVLREMSK